MFNFLCFVKHRIQVKMEVVMIEIVNEDEQERILQVYKLMN